MSELEEAFWSEIVQHHVLSLDRVAAYRDAANPDRWVPLGRILIREGYLSVRQVMGLVSMQAEEPRMRIGDLAVREGLCTREEIQECLAIQSRLSPGPIQLVLRDGHAASDRLVNALVGYIHYLEGRLEEAESGEDLLVQQVI